MKDQRALRFINAMTTAVDQMEPKNLEVLVRYYMIDALYPAALLDLPETINLSEPPELLADSSGLAALMAQAIERGQSAAFVAQGLAYVVTDIFRAINEEDQADPSKSHVEKMRSKLYYEEVESKLAPLLRNETVIAIRDGL